MCIVFISPFQIGIKSPLLDFSTANGFALSDSLWHSRVVWNTPRNNWKHDQGGGKRLPNYHLVGENWVLVCENFFGLPDLVGENICLLQIM